MCVETQALEQLQKTVVQVGRDVGHTMLMLDALRCHEDPVLRLAYATIHDLMGDLASVLVAADLVLRSLPEEGRAVTPAPLGS